MKDSLATSLGQPPCPGQVLYVLSSPVSLRQSFLKLQAYLNMLNSRFETSQCGLSLASQPASRMEHDLLHHSWSSYWPSWQLYGLLFNLQSLFLNGHWNWMTETLWIHQLDWGLASDPALTCGA